MIEVLAPNEVVTVSYGYDEEKLGVSIRDQCGTITSDEVLYEIASIKAEDKKRFPFGVKKMALAKPASPPN